MAILGLALLALLLPASARAADTHTDSMARIAGGSGVEAGLIAGRDPVTGFAGVAPGARLVSLKVAGADGERAHRLDIPAADPFVIAAGATDTLDTADPADDRVAEFSSRSRFRAPDVVAPGTRMVSLRVPGSALDREFPTARIGTGFFRGSGTSQAAAVVSGIVARLLSDRPELGPDQVKALLTAGAVDLPDPREADGAGRIDLARTLAAPVPDAESARQTWRPAVVDRWALARALRDRDEYETGGAESSGRRWSGRRRSGRRWSGASWIHSLVG